MERTPIIGHLICQNGIHEILRCIESVYPAVDEYYVVDGGSTDGTWELLEKYKDVYNLTLFQNKFESMSQQRNWLLDKTPKDRWIITLDQDEKLTEPASKGLKDFLNHIDVQNDGYPWIVGLGFLNLIQDIQHHSEDPIRINNNKIFFYNNNLHFENGYHANIVYDGDTQYRVFETPFDWLILHYAWLNPDRIKDIQKDVKSGKRDYKEYTDGFNQKGIYEF